MTWTGSRQPPPRDRLLSSYGQMGIRTRKFTNDYLIFIKVSLSSKLPNFWLFFYFDTYFDLQPKYTFSEYANCKKFTKNVELVRIIYFLFPTDIYTNNAIAGLYKVAK